MSPSNEPVCDIMPYFYHSQMKMRESNVFRGVCLSIERCHEEVVVP